jgi:hypothetical protein
VTSGYCPRYRYTLIATLTLANLYYICVDFLPTHTIGESVLPAHFLRAFVGLSFVGLFMWIDSLGVRGRVDFRWVVRAFRAGIIRWVILCSVVSLGHFGFRRGESFVGSFFVRSWESFVGFFGSWEFRCWIIFRWLLWASLPFFVGLFVGEFYVDSK